MEGKKNKINEKRNANVGRAKIRKKTNKNKKKKNK